MKKKKQVETQIYTGPFGATATAEQITQMPKGIAVFYNEGGK